MQVVRTWGHYDTLFESDDSRSVVQTKLKTLTVLPGRALSFQKHEYRSEVWVVLQGYGTAIIGAASHELEPGTILRIGEMVWHQLINGSKEHVLVIAEVQYGERCEESDIYRQGEE